MVKYGKFALRRRGSGPHKLSVAPLETSITTPVRAAGPFWVVHGWDFLPPSGPASHGLKLPLPRFCNKITAWICNWHGGAWTTFENLPLNARMIFTDDQQSEFSFPLNFTNMVSAITGITATLYPLSVALGKTLTHKVYSFALDQFSDWRTTFGFTLRETAKLPLNTAEEVAVANNVASPGAMYFAAALNGVSNNILRATVYPFTIQTPTNAISFRIDPWGLNNSDMTADGWAFGAGLFLCENV